MCAMPGKKRDSVHDEFHHYFNELENDFLNIHQILKGREKSGASFNTIASELEALKEDAIDNINAMNGLCNNNRNHFPKNTLQMLDQCNKLIQNVHPEYLSQRNWDFNEQWLASCKKTLGY